MEESTQGALLKRLEEVLRKESLPVLEAMRRGEITPADAYKLVESILRENGHEELLYEARLMVPPTLDDAPPVVMSTAGGIPMLNPLLQASLAESIILDGDAPSMRMGPPPEGFSPAVPVETNSANPVLVGMMLERASEEVLMEFKQAGKALETRTTALEKREPVTGVPGYEAGSLPALRRVAHPSPVEASLLPPEKRRELARKALVTTQGRRSLVPALVESLRKRLEARGVVFTATGSPKGHDHQIDWCLAGAGVEELQESFSPVESAAAFFAKHIAGAGRPCTLHVKERTSIGDRRFGWTLHYTLGD